MRILSQNTNAPNTRSCLCGVGAPELFVLSALHGSRCLSLKSKIFQTLTSFMKDLKASFGSLFCSYPCGVCLHTYNFLTVLSTKCLISFSLFQYVLEHFHKKEFTKRKRYVKIKARYSQSNLALSLFWENTEKFWRIFVIFLPKYLCAIFGILTTTTPLFYPTFYFVPPLSGSLVLCPGSS